MACNNHEIKTDEIAADLIREGESYRDWLDRLADESIVAPELDGEEIDRMISEILKHCEIEARKKKREAFYEFEKFVRSDEKKRFVIPKKGILEIEERLERENLWFCFNQYNPLLPKIEFKCGYLIKWNRK